MDERGEVPADDNGLGLSAVNGLGKGIVGVFEGTMGSVSRVWPKVPRVLMRLGLT